MMPASLSRDHQHGRADQEYPNRHDTEDETDGGYSAIQITQPGTLAAALLNSLSGLASWIVGKYRAWSDCRGKAESRFSKDVLLTIVTLYWATGSIACISGRSVVSSA